VVNFRKFTIESKISDYQSLTFPLIYSQ